MIFIVTIDLVEGSKSELRYRFFPQERRTTGKEMKD